jgi:hypothetical protein
MLAREYCTFREEKPVIVSHRKLKNLNLLLDMLYGLKEG